MPLSVKMLNDQIKKISETNTLLDMLLEFEKVLEDMDIYAYENWSQGEVLEGPTLDRHFVTVKLMYAGDKCPDPQGAMRLLDSRCLVRYNKEHLITPVRVKSFDDVTLQGRPDGTLRRKAKTRRDPVWVVEIQMPRKYVDEFSTEVVQADEDQYVDTESLNDEQQAQAELQMTGQAAQPPGLDDQLGGF